MPARNPLTPQEIEYVKNQYHRHGSAVLARTLGRSRSTIWTVARNHGLTGEQPPKDFMPLLEAAMDLGTTPQALHRRVAVHPDPKKIYTARNGRAYLRRSYVTTLIEHYDVRTFTADARDAGYLTVREVAHELGVPVSTVRQGLRHGTGALADLRGVRVVYAPYGPRKAQHAYLFNPHDVLALDMRRRARLAALRRTHEPIQRVIDDTIPNRGRMEGRAFYACLRAHVAATGGAIQHEYLSARRHTWVPHATADHLRSTFGAASAARKEAA